MKFKFKFKMKMKIKFISDMIRSATGNNQNLIK